MIASGSHVLASDSLSTDQQPISVLHADQLYIRLTHAIFSVQMIYNLIST